MELSKKATILFPPELYDHLTGLAKQRRVSVGDLVRTACQEHYGLYSAEDRLAAVDKLRQLSLPVSDPASMKRESVPAASEILR